MTTATAAPPVDPATATAIRHALAAANMGRVSEACSLAEQALASGGDRAALNAMLGMFRARTGEHEIAVRHLEIAHSERPADVRIATNLASALVSLGDFGRAFEIASKSRALADPTLQLARLRGYAADQLELFPEAVEAYEHVVTRVPEDWESWNNLGNARRGITDFDGCVEAHKRAVELNPLAAPSRLNLGNALRDVGRFDEAEAEFRRMAADFPDDAKPLRELHLLYKAQGRDEDALDAISRSVEREPSNIELLLAKASHSSLLHRMEAAETTYRRVIEIDPANTPAHLGLALVYELSNRGADLAALANEAAERGVTDDALNFISAYHHRRSKQFELGLAALEKVPEELETPRRLHLLAQMLDGAGRYEEAIDAFSRMNQLLREDPTKPEERGASYRNLVGHSRDIVTEEWVRGWRAEAEPDGRPAPVFLVGFPRSGTTLLDTLLMGHPKVEVLEEEPPLRHANELLADFESLPTVPEEQVRAAREAYFECAASLAPLAPGNVLVDKNPLTMNLVPLVRRIFPEARIILALRHPCDVVLSCFMANFRLNDGMASFLRLETAAELYDKSFSYFEHVQRLMPMPMHVVVYENIVADRARELRALFDFLRLDWHDAVLDHEETARKRGRIKTASYSQVVEPIYARSAGRWRNYRKHLEPVLPVLAPWAEKFGYTI